MHCVELSSEFLKKLSALNICVYIVCSLTLTSLHQLGGVMNIRQCFLSKIGDKTESVTKQKPGILQDVRFLPLLLLALFAFAACALTVSMPNAARATQALPADVKILLGFRERYGPDNKQHLGIDVYSPKGSELYAPVGGTISFLGRVPGSAGLNVMVLTIRTDEGDLVSINPFLTTAVQAGDTVTRGQMLGTVSDVGDPSSPESHFHLSLRVNGVYRDPTHLLMETAGVTGGVSGAPNTPAAPSPSPVPSPVPAPAATPATAGQTQVQAANSAVGQSAAATAASPQTAGQTQGSSAAVRTTAGFAVDSATVNATAGSNNSETAASNTLALQPKSALVGTESGNSVVLSTAGRALQNGTATASSLRAEAVAWVQELSQLQLMGILFLAVMVASSAGLGVWRSVQLMGLDTSMLRFKEQIITAAKGIVRPAEN